MEGIVLDKNQPTQVMQRAVFWMQKQWFSKEDFPMVSIKYYNYRLRSRAIFEQLIRSLPSIPELLDEDATGLVHLLRQRGFFDLS